MNVGSNRGRGFGRRFRGGYGRGVPGLGFRHRYGDSYRWDFDEGSERTLIENEIRILKDQLSGLEDRLSKMEKEDKEGVWAGVRALARAAAGAGAGIREVHMAPEVIAFVRSVARRYPMRGGSNARP
jgi:hypothetical protein